MVELMEMRSYLISRRLQNSSISGDNSMIAHLRILSTNTPRCPKGSGYNLTRMEIPSMDVLRNRRRQGHSLKHQSRIEGKNENGRTRPFRSQTDHRNPG